MTSLISATKQIPANAGYYITVSSIANCFYANSGTDEAPVMNNGAATSTLSTSGAFAAANAPGAVFRDHGKTLLSSGRVFRKVQMMRNTGAVQNLGTDGVGGVAAGASVYPTAYLTGYIELPGTGGASSGSGAYTPVARLG